MKVSRGSKIFLAREDLRDEPMRLRLKDLCNVDVRGNTLVYAGNDLAVLKEGVRIVHWAPADSVPAEVLMTDGTARKGVAEPSLTKSLGEVVQLERFAFVRVEQVNPTVKCVFTHR